MKHTPMKDKIPEYYTLADLSSDKDFNQICELCWKAFQKQYGKFPNDYELQVRVYTNKEEA